MTAAYDLYVRQGETTPFTLNWKEGDDTVDLTGYTAEFTLRTDFRSETKIIDLKSATGGIVLTDTDPNTVVLILPEVTSGITVPATAVTKTKDRLPYFLIGRYNLEYTAGDGTVTRLIEGNFYMDGEIVR